MALIKRGDLAAAPELRREIVAVEALGGDVAVVELGLAERLDFEKTLASAKLSKRSVTNALMGQMLASCVLDAEDEPIYDAKEWQAWGARNRNAAVQLFNVAFRLSGFDGNENSKNS